MERAAKSREEIVQGLAAKLAAPRFDPTMVAPHLWTEHCTVVAPQTLRGWMREPGLRSRARRRGVPQFWRMCQKLCIEIIGAKSLKTKGRVELSHGTQQDRLIKKMQLVCSE